MCFSSYDVTCVFFFTLCCISVCPHIHLYANQWYALRRSKCNNFIANLQLSMLKRERGRERKKEGKTERNSE